MSTTTPGAPPIVPPTGGPPVGTDGEPLGDGKVTRNVPPKRVMVTNGNQVTYAGVSYGPGDSFLIGEGPVADSLAMAGQVVIVDHEQVAEWNGKEGQDTIKRAHALIDNHHAQVGGERTHDHGFAKYEHADGPDAFPVNVTEYRQQAATDPRVPRPEAPDQTGGEESK